MWSTGVAGFRLAFAVFVLRPVAWLPQFLFLARFRERFYAMLRSVAFFFVSFLAGASAAPLVDLPRELITDVNKACVTDGMRLLMRATALIRCCRPYPIVNVIVDDQIAGASHFSEQTFPRTAPRDTKPSDEQWNRFLIGRDGHLERLRELSAAFAKKAETK